MRKKQEKKKRLKSGLAYTEHRNTAKKNREIRHNHAENRRANNKKFRMFRNTTISEFKTTIREVLRVSGRFELPRVKLQ